jgi:hypothetical protein
MRVIVFKVVLFWTWYIVLMFNCYVPSVLKILAGMFWTVISATSHACGRIRIFTLILSCGPCVTSCKYHLTSALRTLSRTLDYRSKYVSKKSHIKSMQYVASVLLKWLAYDYPYMMLQCPLELEFSRLFLSSDDIDISAGKHSLILAERCQTTYIHYVKSKILSY